MLPMGGSNSAELPFVDELPFVMIVVPVLQGDTFIE